MKRLHPVSETEDAARSNEQIFLTYCGSVNELISTVGLAPGEKVSESDLKELQSMRGPILDVIKNGATALNAISEEGNKSDIGGFGVILTRGCKDMTTNEVINDGPGIQLCKDILANIMKD